MENGVRTLDVDTHTSSRHSVVRTLKGTHDPAAVFQLFDPPLIFLCQQQAFRFLRCEHPHSHKFKTQLEDIRGDTWSNNSVWTSPVTWPWCIFHLFRHGICVKSYLLWVKFLVVTTFIWPYLFLNITCHLTPSHLPDALYTYSDMEFVKLYLVRVKYLLVNTFLVKTI